MEGRNRVHTIIKQEHETLDFRQSNVAAGWPLLRMKLQRIPASAGMTTGPIFVATSKDEIRNLGYMARTENPKAK